MVAVVTVRIAISICSQKQVHKCCWDTACFLRGDNLARQWEEAGAVKDMDRNLEIDHLRTTYQTYDNSVRRLPNPDAFVSQSKMRGLAYLDTWAEGLEATL